MGRTTEQLIAYAATVENKPSWLRIIFKVRHGGEGDHRYRGVLAMPCKVKVFLIALLLLLAAGSSLTIISSPQFQKWYRPPVAQSIVVDEIATMKASIDDEQDVLKKLPQFVVSPKHYQSILKWLQPAEYPGYTLSYNLPRYSKVGELWIACKDGRDLHIIFRDWGQNPVAFTENGQDYFLGNPKDKSLWGGSSGLLLGFAIQKAYEEQNSQTTDQAK